MQRKGWAGSTASGVINREELLVEQIVEKDSIVGMRGPRPN